MKIMRLTHDGILHFIQSIDLIKSGAKQGLPEELFQVGDYANEIGGEVQWLDDLDLDNKLNAARDLDVIVSKLGLESAERDTGFWAWCSAYLFLKLCNRKNGVLRPGEIAIWVSDYENWQRYYRHYLASIWRVYKAHSDREGELVVLLNGPVNVPGELWGQVAASQGLVTNPKIIRVIYQLYWDKLLNKRKRGAGGRSPRRLRTVLRQFERTWDFYSMPSDKIIELLPGEFDRFKELD